MSLTGEIWRQKRAQQRSRSISNFCDIFFPPQFNTWEWRWGRFSLRQSPCTGGDNVKLLIGQQNAPTHGPACWLSFLNLPAVHDVGWNTCRPSAGRAEQTRSPGFRQPWIPGVEQGGTVNWLCVELGCCRCFGHCVFIRVIQLGNTKRGRKPRRYGCAMACSLMDFIVSSPINQIIITTLVTITTSPSCWVSFSVFHRPSNSAVTLCVDAGIDRETRGGDNSLLKAFLSQINLRVLPSSFNCDTRLYECMA